MAHLPRWARELAAARMAEPLPRRWAHVQAVAAKAKSLRHVLGEDADLLVMAAWLHDVGYAPDVQGTDFHPLDGARYLRSLDADPRLCGLVANHSGAKYEAELRDLVDELAEFPDEKSLARDAAGAESPPTAGMAGLLYRLNFDHPWREAASRFCWHAVQTDALPVDVHALAEVLVFLAHVPDRERASRYAPGVLERMAASPMSQAVPKSGEYGLTPLHVAPTADAPWRRLFEDGQIEVHLDHLAAAQQPDGGWPVTWEPPNEASRLEWRGVVTRQALRTLTFVRPVFTNHGAVTRRRAIAHPPPGQGRWFGIDRPDRNNGLTGAS